MNNFKIKKIQFINHPILGDLEVDFCNKNGEPADTIIIAGENGAGKSTLIDCIYRLTCSAYGVIRFECNVEIVNKVTKEEILLKYNWNDGAKDIWFSSSKGEKVLPGDDKSFHLYPFTAIYSDVDINFKSENIRNVSFGEVDKTTESRKSSGYLAQEIKQLLVDIRAMDSEDLTKDYRQATRDGNDTSNLILDRRLSRFTNAFNYMFDDIDFFGIENIAHEKINDGYKNIVFKKGEVKISIDDLSSGEKQIVYRNSFLLKDQNALKGAFVFIDEPEISLHPKWQEKILDNYKRIFTDENGVQTSQMFVVTHSPFIIHNENRKNDKVIVLQKGADGKITVSDKPEYYKCNSVELVQDAFNLDFSKKESLVYLAGRTDEMYFNKCLDVYKISVPFEFKWVGYFDNNGREVNSGDSALNNLYHNLLSANLQQKNVCLYDCDANKEYKQESNVCVFSIEKNISQKRFKKGIENALIVDEVDSCFYETQESIGDYGEAKSNDKFKKMEYCKHICSLPDNDLKLIFANLKKEIEKLIAIFSK